MTDLDPRDMFLNFSLNNHDLRWELECALNAEIANFVEAKLHDLNNPELVGTKLAIEVQTIMNYLEEVLEINWLDDDSWKTYTILDDIN